MSTITIDEYGRVVVYDDSLPIVVSAPHPGPIIPPMPAFAVPRDSKWAPFLHALLKASPNCLGCGRLAVTGHHEKPFHDFPELELVATNILTVCLPCHFVVCHGGDWRLTIVTARRDLNSHRMTVSIAKKGITFLETGRSVMPGPAALAAVLGQKEVSTDELLPFMQEITSHDPKVPTRPELRVRGILGGLIGGGFDDPLWLAYKKIWGVTWDKAGQFLGDVSLDIRGPRDYVFRNKSVPPFQFIRHTGEVISPPGLVTDGGSIPRIAWSIPGLDPWGFMQAFLIHDWDFMAHHCHPDYPRSFNDANDTLGEAVYTMMTVGMIEPDWRVLATIVAGVSSFVGRQLWDRVWTPDQCSLALNV